MTQIKSKMIKVMKIRHKMKRPNLIHANFACEGMTPARQVWPGLNIHLQVLTFLACEAYHSYRSENNLNKVENSQKKNKTFKDLVSTRQY